VLIGKTEVSAMYARVRKATGEPAAEAGCVEQLMLRRVAGREELHVSLWAGRDDAQSDPTAEWYEVEADQRLASRDEPGSVAALVYFDGPMSQELHDAATRANRDRIGPAMTTHPGAVRTLVLWQPEHRSQLVVALATSLESIEDGQRAISAMELLPGEDPALLPGPDRIDLYRVVPNGSTVR
jgi:hypothetical protein